MARCASLKEVSDVILTTFLLRRKPDFQRHQIAFGSAQDHHLHLHTLGDMTKALNRSPVYLRGLQARFELPTFEGARYSDAYQAFLRTIIFLRTLGISEETLRDLWHTEKKLLALLHVDSTGSSTWFLDACGQTSHRERRLLLTNHDLGMPVPSKELQLGLDFSAKLPELFEGTEMGEDALRVLNDYLKLYHRIRAAVKTELPHVKAATAWASRLR
jgi:hypothetical protein